MKPTRDYLAQCERLIDAVRGQENAIEKAAEQFAQTILAGRMVHVFGSGHSRIMVEEMWPRYGSFPGFNPIVELSLTFHNPVVGANGQRQAMFLENVSGLAARILRNFALSNQDSALVISSSGCNLVPIEIAEEFRKAGIPVVAIVSLEHARGSKSKREDGKKLQDFANIVLDTGVSARRRNGAGNRIGITRISGFNHRRVYAHQQPQGRSCTAVDGSRSPTESARGISNYWNGTKRSGF